MQTEAAGERSAYLDNAKALLIILVVFGHLFGPVLGRNEPGRWLYLLICAFHMPAFAFVCGWLSRREVFSQQGVASLLRLVRAFLVATAVIHMLWVVAFDEPFIPHRYVVTPYFALWFLLALIWWRLLLPLFGAGTGPRAAALSVAAATGLSVLAGYLPFDGTIFAASRTLGFLPFFVAGYRFKQLGLTPRCGPVARALGIVAFASTLALFASGRFTTSAAPFFRDRGYADMAGIAWGGPLEGVGLLALSAVLVAAFLALVPSRRLSITHLGATLVSVYVWHALLVRVMKELDLTHALVGNPFTCILATAGIVLLFGYGPIARLSVRALTGSRV